MPPLSDAIVAALIAATAASLGAILTRRTARDQTTIQVMQAQISQLWERVQQQESRIDDLVSDRQRERKRAWAAIRYIRSLIEHIDALKEFIPLGSHPPPMPTPPDELDEDL